MKSFHSFSLFSTFFSIILLIISFFSLSSSASDYSASPINLSLSGSIVCFADFNSDKFTDLITVKSIEIHKYLFEVHLYGSDDIFKSNEKLRVELIGAEEINNVAAGDFNSDGNIDFLIAMKDLLNNQEMKLIILLGSIDHFLNPTNPLVLPPSRYPFHPLLFDFNGDFLIDIYSVSSATGLRSIWVNKYDYSTGELKFDLLTHANESQFLTVQPSPSIAVPLFSSLNSPVGGSFVDVNGDCLSDLFLVTRDAQTGQIAFELWINRKSIGFQLHWNKKFDIAISSAIGIPVWQDFDSDGTLDLSFPICEPANTCADRNEIHFFYNVQKPMCGNVWQSSDSCRSQQSLCESDENFSFANFNELTELNNKNSPNHVVVGNEIFSQFRFATNYNKPNDFNHPPLVLRFGDVNLDGFPDLLVGLQKIGSEPPVLNYQLFISVGCSDSACGSLATSHSRRRFVAADFQPLEGAYVGAFLDVDNDGKLDLFFSIVDYQRSATRSAIFFNSAEFDAYFLTVSVGNGVCPSWCSTGEKFPSPKPYGAAQPGAIVKFTLTDLDGSKRPRSGVQLPFSSNLALSPPYLFFGLDRTNNYIEEFFVGLPSNFPSHWNIWVAMIPNSQVEVFPFPRDEPNEWTMELFISPSNKLISVTIALLSVLAANALVIAYFQWRENKEDEKEKTKNALLFTF